MQGLKNLGNTCSINTLIQCIGHCEPLRNWFLSEEPHQLKDRDERQLYISVEFARILHEMWVEKKSLAPVRFIKTLYQSLDGMIQAGEQLDIVELWMLIVDRINEDIGSSTVTPMIEGSCSTMDDFMSSWKRHNEKKMSQLLKMIQGWTTTRIECDLCHQQAKLFEPFCALGLDLHDVQGSFQSMFDNMFKKERISKRTCDYCTSTCSGVKSTSLSLYPHVLVIYFKRFEITRNGIMKKNKEAVDIPRKLRFKITDNENKKYKLVSIGNHVGSLHGGHYYAIARNHEDAWFLYDDINISSMEDITPVLHKNKDAYMLIYESI